MAKRPTKGEGGVYEEPDGRWRAIVYIEGRPIKRRAATREAAEALRQELLKQRDQGIDVGSGGQSLESWLAMWQELKARSLTPRSQTNNRRMVGGYIVPLLGKHAINKVRADQLQSFLHRVQDDIMRESKGRHSGGRTVQALAQLLRAAFDLAVKRRLIPHNPMDGVEVPAHSASHPEPLSDPPLAAMLALGAEHPLAPLWPLYGLLGLRRGEGLGVRWQDVDFEAGTVHIRQQVQEIDGRLVFGPPKYNSVRLLPLPDVCVEPLRARRLAQLRLRASRADTWQDHDLVFCSRDGKPLWPANVDSDFRALCQAAGVSTATSLHALRHTVATLLDECGASEALKAGILGHGKKTITQRYTHARIEAMRRVLDAVSARVLRKAA